MSWSQQDDIAASDKQGERDAKILFRVVVGIAVIGSFSILGAFGVARVYYPPAAIAAEVPK